MCFDLLWKIGFTDSLMQLQLSQCTTVGFKDFLDNPTSCFSNQTASRGLIEAAMYSASVELYATTDFFLLNQDIIAEPRLKQHPVVL